MTRSLSIEHEYRYSPYQFTKYRHVNLFFRLDCLSEYRDLFQVSFESIFLLCGLNIVLFFSRTSYSLLEVMESLKT